MILGFTGTQHGMRAAQWAALWQLLVPRSPGDFHHGDCIGADEQAAKGARLAGFRIIGHPPIVQLKRAYFPADEMREPLPYLDRNKRIVAVSQEMIATPGEFAEVLRSGTWSTVRYARRVGKTVHVILPDGRVVL